MIRGKKYGEGKMYYANNKTLFEGRWRDDERDGEGTLY